MGGSSGQVTGYRYYTNFLLFIGNPIEKLISINFDKRGWVPYNQFSTESVLNIDEAYMYGENEGGVYGDIDIYTGTSDQQPNTVYKDYMESIGLKASGFPYQSYLVFRGSPSTAEWAPAYNQPFYVGNSGYMKEMLLWPKRIHVRNDGRGQWYDLKAEIGEYYYDGEELIGNVDPLKLIDKGSAFSVNWQGQKSDLGSNQTGFFELWTGYTSANDIVLNVRSLLWPIPSSSMGISSNAISGALKTIQTEPWAKAVGGYLTFPRGKNMIAKIYVSYSTASDAVGTFDWLIDPPEVHDGKAQKPSIGTDINPIHKIREILTDDTAMNKPESSVNDVNFVKAADRIWDEGLGVSWSITEKSCIDAINELCYHIEAGIRVNRQTGLYEMVLFRDDWFKEEEIHSITESKIKSMQYEITNADEVINQVNVNFYDRENIKNSSFSISENGLIQTLGRVNAETLDFPYFMNMRNAEIVANWKLKQLSTGAFKGSFITGWREARKWNRYDLIRLPWSKRWTGTILVRIMSINLGGPTNNEVSIDFIEVVPSTGMMNTAIVADDPIDKPLPPQPCQYEPFEMPYYLAVMALGQRKVDEELAYENNFGLAGVVAEQPQSNSLYAIMKTHNGVEGEEWLRAGSIQYSQTADLDQSISKTSSSFTVKNWKKIANVPVGTLIKCGRDWLVTPGEWMVFQGVDPYTGIVSVKRGALDTQPQEWGGDTKLYFCGNDISYDQTEYVSGEEVLVSALTTTPSGMLEQGGSIPVEMKARAIRPYPPANVKINGAYWPETQIVTNNIVLTWAHRNRVQQTGGEIIGWFESDVTVESGVTYSYELISENTVLDSQSNINANTVTILASVLKPNKPHTLKLWSIRDSYISYHQFEHSFFVKAVSLILSATVESTRVFGSTLSAANISINVDESLNANMQSDGLAISGKAAAGATITIEIQE